jgi:hypothetical protein
MFCLPLSERCTGSDIFKAVNDYFTAEDISWADCVCICTDGVAALTGHKKGFQDEVGLQQIGPHVNFIHCIIHREALATRDLEPKLHSVIQEAVKVVNYEQARPLNSRLFAVLCEEMQADHKSLLLHSEVRWLSRGTVLKRLVQLKQEVHRFLQGSGSPLYQHFLDKKRLVLLLYLSDTFHKLNGLKSSLQGLNATVFHLFDKVSEFMTETMVWKSLCESDTLEMFVNMSEYLKENYYASEEIKPHVLTHLTNLESNFKNRFPELTFQQQEWMRNPFAVTIGGKISHLPIKAKESLMELSCDTFLKISFEALSLPEL